MKVLVTGNAGSGKSTLSKKLAAASGLPWYGLDAIVWQERWRKTPGHMKKQRLDRLIAQPDWVIDGVSSELQAAADVIIFLDVPRRVCFWRVMRRNYRYLFSSRPGLPANCPEILILPRLIKIIWRFPSAVRPKILAEKARRNKQQFIHIATKTDLQQLSHRQFHS